MDSPEFIQMYKLLKASGLASACIFLTTLVIVELIHAIRYIKYVWSKK
jgi:hypothetical protein